MFARSQSKINHVGKMKDLSIIKKIGIGASLRIPELHTIHTIAHDQALEPSGDRNTLSKPEFVLRLTNTIGLFICPPLMRLEIPSNQIHPILDPAFVAKFECTHRPIFWF